MMIGNCEHTNLTRREYHTEHHCAGRFEILHTYWQCLDCGRKHKLRKTFERYKGEK